MKTAIGFFLGLFVVLSVAQAHAQLTGGEPAGYKHAWTVPGVIDNGVFKTHFACSNGENNAVNVGIEVFGIGDAFLSPLGVI